jgi:hypothetical protein
MVPNGKMDALARFAKLAWIGLLPLLLCGGCGSAPAEPELVRPVRAIKVADIAGFRSRSFPGRAEAVDEVDLSFRVSGPLIQLPVRVGDQVAKGDLLAAIDPIDYRTALDLARGNLQRAEAELLAMEAGRQARGDPAVAGRLERSPGQSQSGHRRTRPERDPAGTGRDFPIRIRSCRCRCGTKPRPGSKRLKRRCASASRAPGKKTAKRNKAKSWPCRRW